MSHALKAHETSVGLLAKRAREFPARPYVRRLHPDGHIETISYLETAARVAGIADALTAMGFRKGDRLCAYFDTVPDGLWVTLGCAALGVLHVPLGQAFSLDALGRLATQCGARAIYTTADRAAEVATLGVRTLVLDATVPGTETIVPLTHSDPLGRLDELSRAIDPEDLYMLQQTSGSTGVPKLVMRKNNTMPFAARICAGGLSPDDQSQLLLTLALTHGGGHYAIHVQMFLAGCLCLTPGVDTSIRIEDAENLLPTELFVTPRVLRVLLRQHAERYGDRAAAEPFVSRRLRGVNIGGGGPDQAQVDELSRRKLPICEVYGATESSVAAASNYGEREPGSMGKLVPEVTTRIADDGELLIKSPYRMTGYWGAPEITAQAIDADGWYHSGDLAEIVRGPAGPGGTGGTGRLRILGRKRDVFNSSEGSNIYPGRIEDLLESSAEVGQAILVGDGLPFIAALVVPRAASGGGAILDPADPRYADVRARIAVINRGLERFEAIRRVVLLDGPFDTLPGGAIYRTVGQGKVARDRKGVSARFAELIRDLYSPAGERFAA